jgi:seryl-tRNA synthetase
MFLLLLFSKSFLYTDLIYYTKMLDIKLIRENPDLIRRNLQKRNDKEKLKLLDELIKMDVEWRESLQETEKLRNQRNIISREIADLKKQGKNADEKLKLAKVIPEKIKELEEYVIDLRGRMDTILMRLPNILHESVPIGADSSENEIVKVVGKKPHYDFELKSHVDLVQDLDLADIERAAKVSGARFYYAKNELVMLDLGLRKLALDLLIQRGYVPIEPPFLIRRAPYEGVTDLNDFEDVLYKIEDEDLYLIATSEHPIASMHMNELLDKAVLPLKYAGISACFRKEAGAHGKDTKGIFRVHQFNKIEQLIFCKPEESWKIHEELLANAEELFQKLGLHYRVVNICTGDIGTVAAKKYDIEAWFPVQNDFREVVSCSNCTDYQARRLNIKYDDNGERKFIHTLNSTAIAIGRALVAIIENYQQKDGTIKIPEVLVPFMNGQKEIKPKKRE